jgi:hypothetical protein
MAFEYIVVSSVRDADDPDNLDLLRDDWSVHEDFEVARAEYERVRDDELTYSATLTAVISSTDYDTHPDLRLYDHG